MRDFRRTSRDRRVADLWTRDQRSDARRSSVGLHAPVRLAGGRAKDRKTPRALIVHSAWIVSPLLIRGNRWNWTLGAIAAVGGAFYDPNPMFWASLGLGVVFLSSCFRRGFLEAWVLIFFAGALIVFFAGSARYLLPIAAPIAILATNRCSTRDARHRIRAANGALARPHDRQLSNLGAYRQFAISLAPEAAARRMWVDHDWGLRYYLESEGALAVPRGQTFAPGDVVVSRSFIRRASRSHRWKFNRRSRCASSR